MSHQHHEFKPRSRRKNKTKKRFAIVFLFLTILIVCSIGIVSAKLIYTDSVEERPLEFIEKQINEISDVSNLVDEQIVVDRTQADDEAKLTIPVTKNQVEKLNKETTDHTTETNLRLEKNPENNLSIESSNQKNQIETNRPIPPSTDSNRSKLKNKNENLSNATENVIHQQKIIEIHIVQPKETLFSITMRYYLSSSHQDTIAHYNGINDPETEIKVGMKLKIPDPHMRYHVIQDGETLFSITNKYYGKSQYQQPLDIYNGINDPTIDFKVGLELKIPHSSILEKQPIEGYIVKINKTNNLLTVYYNNNVLRSFSVATGKDPSRTPEGMFKIVNKVEKPWFNPENIRGGDPENPLGSHWLGLDVPGTNGFIYGIHGTNNPSSIGEYVSLGCIRMYNADIEWLYHTVPLHTPVHIFSK